MPSGSYGGTLRMKPQQWASALALFLLAFQLARFYVVIPVDQDSCMAAHSEHGVEVGLPFVGTHSHGHPQGAPLHEHEALAQTDTDRNYFQHCKDELTALTSVQIFGALVQQWREVQVSRWVHFSITSPSSIDVPLPPPFEPPKTFM